jgi:hypothetical protein
MKCRNQQTYNYRLTDPDTRRLEPQLIADIFEPATEGFKINLSYGFVLRETGTDNLRYFYPCQGESRILETPFLVQNREDFEAFLARIRQADVLTWAKMRRPNSSWVVHAVTNCIFYVNPTSVSISPPFRFLACIDPC